MNASVRSVAAANQLLACARDLARTENVQGRSAAAGIILNLVAEVDALHQAFKGAVVILDQAIADRTLAQLRATTLLAVAEKIAPVLDQEIEDRKQSCVAEYWLPLQPLSDELHASIRMARG